MAHPTPHNHLFQFVFSDPVQAASYLREILPGELSEHVRWETLSVCAGSYVDEYLDGRQSDLLYAASFHDGAEGFVYILFEHQSTGEPLMPFRILRYMVRIWDQWLRDSPDAVHLPLILPVVLFHGGERWSAPDRFSDLLRLPIGYSLKLRAFIPDFRLHVEDLSGVPDDELQGEALARMTLLLLKHAFTGKLWTQWTQSVGTLQQILRANNGLDAIKALIRYSTELSQPSVDLHSSQIKTFIQQNLGTTAMQSYETLAQHLTNQGIEQGQVQGQLAERQRLLGHLLEKRFGPLPAADQQRIAAADYATLAVWVDRIFQAQSLAEVFAPG